MSLIEQIDFDSPWLKLAQLILTFLPVVVGVIAAFTWWRLRQNFLRGISLNTINLSLNVLQKRGDDWYLVFDTLFEGTLDDVFPGRRFLHKAMIANAKTRTLEKVFIDLPSVKWQKFMLKGFLNFFSRIEYIIRPKLEKLKTASKIALHGDVWIPFMHSCEPYKDERERKQRTFAMLPEDLDLMRDPEFVAKLEFEIDDHIDRVPHLVKMAHLWAMEKKTGIRSPLLSAWRIRM